MDKFELEGFNFKIDEHGRYVIDSIFDKEGNNVQLENVEYDKEGNVIVSDADENATDAEKD